MPSEISIKKLSVKESDFVQSLQKLRSYESEDDLQIEKRVAEIIQKVISEGDEAVLALSNQFDRLNCKSIEELELNPADLNKALGKITKEEREALEISAERIAEYHQHQKLDTWFFEDQYGNTLGQRVRPVAKAGLYVPGGKASYPSSVLMNCIPAKVAGVKEVVMTVPTPNGEVNPLVWAAAKIAGVDRIFTIGGAQAIAALAYGTETIPAVNKIVGPGNIYVATAKRQVFGKVGIDMIAGPSEILIVCDGKTDPDWVAMDLFSQAEHDELAQAILISQDSEFLSRVEQSVKRLLPEMSRKSIIEKSLQNRSAFILVDDLQQAIEIVNDLAPEHLELSMENAREFADEVDNAGAIFIGRYSAEAFGDYCAGSNHVLPTSGSAKFSSPLSVYDFVKRSSLIEISPEGASFLSKTSSTLARSESLEAHALSAEYRAKK